MAPTVSTAVDDHVWTITFGDAATKNALSADLLASLREALEEAAAAEGLRALVLRSEPTDGTFCSGYDMAEFEEGRSPEETERSFDETIRRLREFDYPVVAAIDGDVWGGGVELVATCDLRVVATGARLGITPAKLGIVYDARGVRQFLHLMGPANVCELLYTASPVRAERAREMGLVNHVVDSDEVDGRASELAADIAANAPLSLAGTKRTIRAFLEKPDLTEQEAQRLQELRTEAYESRDHAEAKAAFAEGRTPEFEGR